MWWSVRKRDEEGERNSHRRLVSIVRFLSQNDKKWYLVRKNVLTLCRGK